MRSATYRFNVANVPKIAAVATAHCPKRPWTFLLMPRFTTNRTLIIFGFSRRNHRMTATTSWITPPSEYVDDFPENRSLEKRLNASVMGKHSRVCMPVYSAIYRTNG